VPDTISLSHHLAYLRGSQADFHHWANKNEAKDRSEHRQAAGLWPANPCDGPLINHQGFYCIAIGSSVSRTHNRACGPSRRLNRSPDALAPARS